MSKLVSALPNLEAPANDTVETARVLIQDGNMHYLMVRKDTDASFEASLWAFPGGQTKTGESLIQTARREVKEETGREVNNLAPIQSFTDRYWIEDGHNAGKLAVVTFFHGETDNFDMTIPAEHEYDLISVFKAADLRSKHEFSPASHRAAIKVVRLLVENNRAKQAPTML